MSDAFLSYRRGRFETSLPSGRHYLASHFWIASDEDGSRRVGFTQFATRMLGEVVEFDFEVQPGQSMERGQAIGWFEGFKAVSELYSPLDGRFSEINPALADQIEKVHAAPYRTWLFRAEADLPEDALDAAGYASFLDSTIDRMMGSEG